LNKGISAVIVPQLLLKPVPYFLVRYTYEHLTLCYRVCAVFTIRQGILRGF